MLVRILSLIGIVMDTLLIHKAVLNNNEPIILLGALLMMVCVFANFMEIDDVK